MARERERPDTADHGVQCWALWALPVLGDGSVEPLGISNFDVEDVLLSELGAERKRKGSRRQKPHLGQSASDSNRGQSNRIVGATKERESERARLSNAEASVP